MHNLQQIVAATSQSRSELNQNISLSQPTLSDEVLDVLAANVAGRVPATPPSQEDRWAEELEIDDQVLELARTRIGIEKAARDLLDVLRIDSDSRVRAPSFSDVVERLWVYEVIDRNTQQALLEVYRICSTAIHGRRPTDTQVSFVVGTAPTLLRRLIDARERVTSPGGSGNNS